MNTIQIARIAVCLTAFICSCCVTMASTNHTIGNNSPLFVDTKAQKISVVYTVKSGQLDQIAHTLTAVWHSKRLTTDDVAKLVATTNQMTVEIKLLAKNQQYANASLSHLNETLGGLITITGFNVNAGSISSSGQSGGVTAGSIGTVNQSIQNKSVYASQLRHFYATGVGLNRDFHEAVNKWVSEGNAAPDAPSHKLVYQAEANIDAWTKKTSDWIKTHMGEDSEARFVSGPMDFPNDSENSRLGAYTDNTPLLLENLDAIIRSEAYDPK